MQRLRCCPAKYCPKTENGDFFASSQGMVPVDPGGISVILELQKFLQEKTTQ
jgi:hypothetical protein